jgi:hypothetical protein
MSKLLSPEKKSKINNNHHNMINPLVDVVAIVVVDVVVAEEDFLQTIQTKLLMVLLKLEMLLLELLVVREALVSFGMANKLLPKVNLAKFKKAKDLQINLVNLTQEAVVVVAVEDVVAVVDEVEETLIATVLLALNQLNLQPLYLSPICHSNWTMLNCSSSSKNTKQLVLML